MGSGPGSGAVELDCGVVEMYVCTPPYVMHCGIIQGLGETGSTSEKNPRMGIDDANSHQTENDCGLSFLAVNQRDKTHRL